MHSALCDNILFIPWHLNKQRKNKARNIDLFLSLFDDMTFSQNGTKKGSILDFLLLSGGFRQCYVMKMSGNFYSSNLWLDNCRGSGWFGYLTKTLICPNFDLMVILKTQKLKINNQNYCHNIRIERYPWTTLGFLLTKGSKKMSMLTLLVHFRSILSH